MWCAICRSDVAAEVSPDHRHVRCANCGGEISESLANRTQTRTRQARELLERWSRERAGVTGNDSAPETPPPRETQLEPAAVKHNDAPAAPEPATLPNIAPVDSPKPTPRFRIDAEHKPDELIQPKHTETREETAADVEAATPSAPSTTVPPTEPKPTQQYRVDAAHSVPKPHIAITPPNDGDALKSTSSKWVATVGQSLAYAGVLGLMAGTCLVILGYFRGPASYAPTGWLITMASQMLLFLGVVTLVSSGMEETTNTVADRIDKLGEKLIRIEQATESLRGPHSIKSTSETPTDESANVDLRRAS